jgi:hypothetical protein
MRARFISRAEQYCHAGLNLSANLDASSRGLQQPCSELERRLQAVNAYDLVRELSRLRGKGCC